MMNDETGLRAEIRYKSKFTWLAGLQIAALVAFFVGIFMWPTIAAMLTGEAAWPDFLLQIAVETAALLFLLLATLFVANNAKRQLPFMIDEAGIHYRPCLFNRATLVPWEGTTTIYFPLVNITLVTAVKGRLMMFSHPIIPRLKMIANREEVEAVLEKYDEKELFW